MISELSLCQPWFSSIYFHLPGAHVVPMAPYRVLIVNAPIVCVTFPLCFGTPIIKLDGLTGFGDIVTGENRLEQCRKSISQSTNTKLFERFTCPQNVEAHLLAGYRATRFVMI